MEPTLCRGASLKAWVEGVCPVEGKVVALDQVLLDLCCSMAEHSVHHIVPGARVSAAQAIQFTHHVSQQLSKLHQGPPQRARIMEFRIPESCWSKLFVIYWP